MQEASDAHSKTEDSDTVSTYQVSSVQLVTEVETVSLSAVLLSASLASCITNHGTCFALNKIFYLPLEY